MAESEQPKSPPGRPDWITSFIEYSDVLASPAIFREWAAIGLLSGVMERRLWVHTKGSNLYPNLYTILVGPPGVGKSAVLSQVERFLRSVPDIFVAPSSVSSASLVDSLVLAQRKIIRPNDVPSFVQFHYLTAVASELGVFLPIYDPLFMNSLTKFYDGEHYEERRRTGKVNHLKIEHPHLCIIGGTTPSYLSSFLPDGAWDQGFTSRTLFVYSGEPVYTAIFGDDSGFARLESTYLRLLRDLKVIAGLYGKMEWSREAATAIEAWNRAGCPPVPEHNQRALGWLLDLEVRVVDIFHTKGVAGDSAAIEDCWDFVFRTYSKEKKPIAEHRVVRFLSSKVPSHSVTKVLEVMKQAGMLKLEMVDGRNGFVPAART